MPTSGDRIRELREEKRWTQETLAAAAGLSKGFLSDLENNKRNVSVDYALRIANVLGVSLDYLVQGEQTKRDIERAPVQIPSELSSVAEELELSYAQTLTLLDAHRAVVARRALKGTEAPTSAYWRRLHEAIQQLMKDGSEA